MADPNEEQLLNDLLREVASADLQLGAPDLEARVRAAWPVPAATRRLGARYYPVVCGVAAAVLIVLGLPTSFDFGLRTSGFRPEVQGPKPEAAFVPNGATADTPVTPITQSPITQSPITQSPLEFMPLMPMTAQELTGPFQIVRVQMPRASLGALTPLQHPGELVEADVLLGEDGMARAIHISANKSAYPWRSR